MANLTIVKELEVDQNLRLVGEQIKASVIGVVARGGRVVAELAYDISGRTIRKFLLSNIEKDETILMTDEYRSCNVYGRFS